MSIVSSYPNGSVNYNYPNGINMSIPIRLLETYSSGTKNGSTVSNFFDIQWRRYTTHTDSLLNNNEKYLRPNSRNIENLVLQDRQFAVEGLVIDMIDGGVGFRNRTIPIGFQYGVEWEEDLLFITPESACVDTNLTLDFTIQDVNTTLIPGKSIFLTDRGGFVNLNKTYPAGFYTDTQTNPNLRARAYKGAWLHNAYTALFFNVTNPSNETAGTKAWSYVNSEMNKTFDVFFSGPITDLTFSGLDSMTLTSNFASYIRNMFGQKSLAPNPGKSQTQTMTRSVRDFHLSISDAFISEKGTSNRCKTHPRLHTTTLEEPKRWRF